LKGERERRARERVMGECGEERWKRRELEMGWEEEDKDEAGSVRRG